MKSSRKRDKEIIWSSEPEAFTYVARNIPCQAACPAATDIPGYIRALYEGEYDRSYRINLDANLFPGVLGRICSRPCEKSCRHGDPGLGQSVNICHLKRAASDLRREEGKLLRPLTGLFRGNIGIVGAGPAGLAAAHDLALLGAGVTLYEAFEQAGGMLRYGIPGFRLPRALVQQEIDRILSLGIQLKTGVRLGRDLSVEELLESHDAVLLAAGCYHANRLQVPGEDLPGVFGGLDLMIRVCRGEKPVVGQRTLVLGAGFTAFDCARSALRLGAEEVTICLRRTEQELVVTRDEIHETKAEGIGIASLMTCRKILGDSRVEQVEFVRTGLGPTLADGKRDVIPIQGSEFLLNADSVIVATGQRPESLLEPRSTGAENGVGPVDGKEQTPFHTSMKRVYVTGDFQTGPTTVIEAIASGRRAAELIASELAGRPFRERLVRAETSDTTDRPVSWNFLSPQSMETVLPVQQRLDSLQKEVETGYSGQRAVEESKRCYLCHLHYEIDISRCIYCRYCIDVAPRDCIKLVKQVVTGLDGAISDLVETTRWHEVHAVVIDNTRCIRCGECVRVCPVDCISVAKVELVEKLNGQEPEP